MQKPFPISGDIAFCAQTSNACPQCADCARNASRYDMSRMGRISFFASPIHPKSAKHCDYYIQDDRKPKEARQ